jgi:hypothetical protein
MSTTFWQQDAVAPVRHGMRDGSADGSASINSSTSHSCGGGAGDGGDIGDSARRRLILVICCHRGFVFGRRLILVIGHRGFSRPSVSDALIDNLRE